MKSIKEYLVSYLICKPVNLNTIVSFLCHDCTILKCTNTCENFRNTINDNDNDNDDDNDAI